MGWGSGLRAAVDAEEDDPERAEAAAPIAGEDDGNGGEPRNGDADAEAADAEVSEAEGEGTGREFANRFFFESGSNA